MMGFVACRENPAKKGSGDSKLAEQEQRLREAVNAVERDVDQAVNNAQHAYDEAVRSARRAKTQAEEKLKEMNRSAQDLIGSAASDVKRAASESSDQVAAAIGTAIGVVSLEQGPTPHP